MKLFQQRFIPIAPDNVAEPLNPKSTDPFEMLHEDVHNQILSHLSFRNLLTISGVSSKWFQLTSHKTADKVKLNFKITGKDNFKEIMNVSRNYKTIVMDLSDARPNLIPLVLKRFSESVENLAIAFPSVESKFLTRAYKLKTLNIKTDFIDTIKFYIQFVLRRLLVEIFEFRSLGFESLWSIVTLDYIVTNMMKLKILTYQTAANAAKKRYKIMKTETPEAINTNIRVFLKRSKEYPFSRAELPIENSFLTVLLMTGIILNFTPLWFLCRMLPHSQNTNFILLLITFSMLFCPISIIIYFEILL